MRPTGAVRGVNKDATVIWLINRAPLPATQVSAFFTAGIKKSG
jgi:hypothetical protein